MAQTGTLSVYDHLTRDPNCQKPRAQAAAFRGDAANGGRSDEDRSL